MSNYFYGSCLVMGEILYMSTILFKSIKLSVIFEKKWLLKPLKIIENLSENMILDKFQNNF